MSNEDQAEYWAAQTNWVTYRAAMDATLAPVLDLLFERAALQAGQKVLDVGCGTGASTLRAAEIVGPQGYVLGLDISPTLLEAAREDLAGISQAETLQADAQTHIFDSTFDAMISRFGVMFFEDTTAAFANIARGLRPGAPLTFAAWGPAPDNPFFMVPAKVAQDRMGQPPKTDRTLPGPFAFEDAPRIIGMLEAAGLGSVANDPVTLDLTPPGTAYEAATLLSFIGPVNAVLRHFDGTEDDRAAIRDDLARALERFETTDGLRIPALINLFSAAAPD